MVVTHVSAHIHLLGRVFSQRVSSGQVHQLHLAAVNLKPTLLAVNGHAAVVAHLLLGACHIIEQGCLAAVRVAHKSNTQHIVGQRVNTGYGRLDSAVEAVLHVAEVRVLVRHFDLCRLAVSQRDV